MMRRVTDLEAWLAQRRRVNTRLMAQIAEAPDRRRRKPRDPVEAELLIRHAVEAARRREAEGRLVRLGPRHYELRDRAK